MNRLKSIISLFAFSLLMIGVPAIASAQWNSGGYRNTNSRYNRDIRGNVENLKRGARDFENIVDRGNSRYNNDRNLRNLADRFTSATKDLANSYGRGRNLNNSQDEARRVLDIASQIDQELSSSRGGYGNRRGGGYNNNGGLMSDWSRLRYDLDAVASTYGYNGGRYNSGGSWRNRVPFPLPF